jgi:predicted lipid-binding transport protein (Tim44 family)
MGKWLLLTGILALSGALVATDAEARRLGGGRNIGAQRNVTAPPAQTPAKPAQQAAPAQQGTQPAAAPASGFSRWMPMLGGLALGGMLGYLFGGNGLMGILLIAGLAILAVMAVRAFARRRQGQEVMRPVQYAGMRESVNVPVSTAPVTATSGAAIPAGFDASGFLRAAKMNFLKLQAANDNGRLDDIREFTTDELYAELKNDLGDKQQTEVAGLEADLLEFATEGNRHWASVRFTGSVREAPNAEPEAFTEVWNLVKPADGSTGWLLAGIQQMH